MSYCRFSPTSDVYMYASVYGGYAFHLSNTFHDRHPEIDNSLQAGTRKEAMEIFEKLKEAGAEFPKYAIERLKEEIANEEPEHEPDPAGF